jgi:ArsR family transcriptional regulator
MRRCVGELGRDLSIAPSTVSHHLKELRTAGLIHMERRGQSIECWVEPDTLGTLSEFFHIAKCCERRGAS